jgi:hypothetical protein
MPLNPIHPPLATKAQCQKGTPKDLKEHGQQPHKSARLPKKKTLSSTPREQGEHRKKLT